MTPIPGFTPLNGGHTIHAVPCFCPRCDRSQESYSLTSESVWDREDTKAVIREIGQ